MNRNLYLIFAAMFWLFVAQTSAFVLIPLIASAIGLRGGAIGLLVAMPAGLGLATDVLAATTSDRIGRKPLILVGAIVGVASGTHLAIASDFTALFIDSVGLGLSLSFTLGPVLAYVTEASLPEDAARIQGYLGGVQGSSMLLAALAIGFSIDRLGTQPSSALVAIPMALAFLAVTAVEESVTRGRARSARELIATYGVALGFLLRRPQLQISALNSLIYTMVVFIVGTSFLPIYIVRDLSLPGVLVGILIATRNAALTIASPFFGYVVRRRGFVQTLLGANAASVIGLFGLALVPDWRWLYVPLALAGFGAGFGAASSNLLVASATARYERALGFAANSLMGRAGGLVLPVVFGAILGLWGSHGVFVAAGLLGVVILILIVLVVRNGYQEDGNGFRPTSPLALRPYD